MNAKITILKEKIHKIRNKPSVRDNGRSQHIGSHFLVWKGKNSGKNKQTKDSRATDGVRMPKNSSSNTSAQEKGLGLRGIRT